MAFTTELVLAAQAGPGVDYRTMPTPSRAGSTGSTWATLVTVPISEGTWLLVIDSTRAGTLQSHVVAIRANGGTAQEFRGDTSLLNTTPVRFMTTVTGPASVLIEARYSGLTAGTAHIARIG